LVKDATTGWLIASGLITCLFCAVVIGLYCWFRGMCSRARWSEHKPHIHSRESLNEIEDPSVMVYLLPNGTTVHSLEYSFSKREATIKMSKAIPDEYHQNVLTEAIGFVGKREGIAETNLSGNFVSANTIIVTTSKDIEKEQVELEVTKSQEPQVQTETPTWWG